MVCPRGPLFARVPQEEADVAVTLISGGGVARSKCPLAKTATFSLEVRGTPSFLFVFVFFFLFFFFQRSV